MNKYEIMFITKTNVDVATVKNTVEDLKAIITSMKGEIISFKELGQRELAYPIKKEISGFYYVLNVNANEEIVNEFSRIAGINENIIRHLVINLDKE